MPRKPVYVLKTLAITGQYVPFRGEHIEYSELHRAIKDAQVIADGLDTDIVVVDYGSDAIVAFIN